MVDINLEIKEQEKCKINKLNLNIGGYKNIKFFITSYDNVKELRIKLFDTIKIWKILFQFLMINAMLYLNL